MARMILSFLIWGFLIVGICPSLLVAAPTHHADPSLLHGHRYGPIRKQDTLWSIALLMREKRESIDQVMGELLAANADAFAGKGRTLKPGTYLHRAKDNADKEVAALSLETGSDIAGYLAEKNPAISHEIPDNGFSPDIIPFRQALERRPPTLNGPASLNQELHLKDEKDTAESSGLSDKTVDEINNTGLQNRSNSTESESQIPFWMPFFSGMLGGVIAILLYAYFSKKGLKTYPLHVRGSADDIDVGEEHEDDLKAYAHSTRTRNPNDPVLAPSEQDILNWSKSLAATQVMTNSEELQSNRLSPPN